jgi:hypothetical protein
MTAPVFQEQIENGRNLDFELFRFLIGRNRTRHLRFRF